ncbi:uncharacterized protein Z519_07433 [Cladophialophora bantiana CBS 173.52]|uniref:Uncharacterized protein n=1 Tax=Cladophialophora bantiana (strain ATCC 10958 / CBS 173.52 / CDC B-1940 / NIH 8579) TaxID=1442370 RepID=A0A0D2FYE3_CLAB1|nr:uncharacterized protein Z519_07433 [Cladophialophora bantiana CBS 173.52]KIW91467.1 hypothetical protein Z519_07433 [Cladophialophora bantiana CBS 173.52]
MVVVLVGFRNETRYSVLVRREPSSNVAVPEEMRRQSLTQLFRVTLPCPFRFLATEAITIFAALYNGYLYGLSFLSNDAFNLVFGKHGYGSKLLADNTGMPRDTAGAIFYVLKKFGMRLRRKSPYARQHVDDDDDDMEVNASDSDASEP